jgi:Glycosyltransferase family 87
VPQDSGKLEVQPVLASGQVRGAGAGSAQADGAVALPALGIARRRLRLPRVRVSAHPIFGRLALGSLILGSVAVVAFARSGPTVLVPESIHVFPPWEAGPLHLLLGRLPHHIQTLAFGFSYVLLAMTVAYLVLVAAVRTLSMRAIVVSVLLLHLVFLMGPPLQLSDLFNYLGYARLGGLHHLNPYTHVIGQEVHDPVYRFTSWHNLHSPYGPLFTAATYPLGLLPLPLAYWILKTFTMLASLGFIALVWRCAQRLGRDPRFAVVFVALNPIYLIYAMGGFHNDLILLVPSMGAILLLLERRYRVAGAVLMLAVAIKFSAILLLPFLLVAARTPNARRQLIVGSLLGALPLAALSVALFGFSIPNLQDQSTLLTNFSIPNVFGLLIGLGGGAPALLRAGNVALVITIALLLRRRHDWLAQAGWGTLALIASLAWLVPWYVVWLLPLAALGTSLRLRRAALVLTGYLVIAFAPMTGLILASKGVDLMSSPVGHASHVLQNKLANQPQSQSQ